MCTFEMSLILSIVIKTSRNQFLVFKIKNMSVSDDGLVINTTNLTVRHDLGLFFYSNHKNIRFNFKRN
jgi:hypothetical protein